MDLFQILSDNEKVIVFSSVEERSIFTWNFHHLLEWWRPIVRTNNADYANGKFDPNDYELVRSFIHHDLNSFETARMVAQSWMVPNGSS